MDEWHFIAERKIQEAIEEGAFEHLEGSGKPIDMTENPFEDPSLRMAHRLLRNNGFAPAWIEEGKEIAREITELAGLSQEDFARETTANACRLFGIALGEPPDAI